MKQFFFGSTARRLYGVYHPAQSASSRAPSVVILNPFGAEAIRAFRTCRVLARQLAQSGCHVLRFDYFGTGESGGAGSDFTLHGAVEDTLLAHQEIVDLSSNQRVCWVGLRLGALIAVLASQKKPRGLRDMILWDQILNGADYLAELRTAHIEEVARSLDLSAKAAEKLLTEEELETEALGFPLAGQLRQQLSDVGFCSELNARPARRVLSIGSPPPDLFAQKLEELKAQFTNLPSPDDQDWNSAEALTTFSVPNKTISLVHDVVMGAR